MPQINLKQINKIHFTGIKGVGMSGLTLIAKQMGKQVTGSDVEEKFITDKVLLDNGIQPLIGFDPDRVEQVDLVICTGAHGGKTNPEPIRAQKLGILVLMQAEALGLFSQGKKVIAISGCHGKTTTSAMLAWVLQQAGLDPSFAVGTSEIAGLGFAARYGQGEYFVIEADEYMTCPKTDRAPRFLYLNPFIIVVTNIEHDHPDRYASIAETQEVFGQLLDKTAPEGLIVAGIDNQHLADLLKNKELPCPLITYGQSEQSDWQIAQLVVEEGQTRWEIKKPRNHTSRTDGFRVKPGMTCPSHEERQDMSMYTLAIPGEHNAYNATAVLAVCQQLGLGLDQIKQHLASFRGLTRRFEFKGEKQGVKVYDDYAHHPTEIKATLKAARAWFPKQRIIVIFQAHTYSRTRLLFDEFCQA
ncbi:MAG TPA: UDP-N-acetylmuramate--L-alanine ligase, partial [Candidatus Wirthbacteria bacterium]|nr:UDP-N-acetylmuramate--L-alanine ligase [Candidatus Wirthbacteria bacterium]